MDTTHRHSAPPQTSQASQASHLNDAQKADLIRAAIQHANRELRRKHPWLRHQDAIGAGILILSLAGIIASGWLYLAGLAPWWLTIPLTAIFASFVHELEHDLIHQMYFRHQPRVRKVMLSLGWLARASTANPFSRRDLHMHHHKFSGTASDLEERGITNGEPWGLRRLLMTGDNMMAIMLRPRTMAKAVTAYVAAQKPANRTEARKLWRAQLTAFMPLGQLYHLAFHGWVAWHALRWVLPADTAPLLAGEAGDTALGMLDAFAVVYMLPSLLRTFCLQFISSNMHYYGDIEPRNPMQQCQVLNVWWLWPMQLFCFNFGSTHAIHHFVVKEPFYIRQWTAPRALAIMRHMGVRFNDLGTFGRANRFHAHQAHRPA